MKDNKRALQFSLDYRILSAILGVIVLGMLFAWRPWTSSLDANRTVSVEGKAVISATPDEFVFYPTYEVTNADQQAGLNALSQKSDELIAKLKDLGVSDENIKTSASNYDKYYYPERSGTETNTYTLQLTVTVDSREFAQKIQDYLVTTGPTGSISPQPTFSTALRSELESKARDEATKDARLKAEQSAGNLGFGLGKVKSVEDNNGFGGVMPLDATISSEGSKRSLAVQPGENEINYSVNVTYYLK